MRESANTALKQAYERFIRDLGEFAPELLGDSYSNPYLSSIPENWFQTEGPRIMIVGEEGSGTYGCGKQGEPEELRDVHDIEGIQKLNEDYLKIQLGRAPGKINYSPFWRRFREIAAYGECCWSNIDKIHLLRKRKCALRDPERRQLHSIPTRILHEEIEILDPTHIVFFGWYGVSLKHELPEVFWELYPNDLGDNSVWYKRVVHREYEGRHYIFAYHPNWGYRIRDYEKCVIDKLKETLSIAVSEER